MKLQHSLIALVVGALVVGAALPTKAQGTATARTSDANGVRIVIKPKNVADGAPWEFEVTMDTHTKPLDQDLTKNTVLLDAKQQRYTPTAWQGDPPGGHHRKGVLRFPAPANTNSFAIQMNDIGGPTKHVFRWESH